MMIYWINTTPHLLDVGDDFVWYFTEDFYEESEVLVLYLVVGRKRYVVADGYEYLQKHEYMGLDAVDLQQFYEDIVMFIATRISANVKILNLEEIKNYLLCTYWWPAWFAEGKVTGNFCGGNSMELPLTVETIR